MTTKYWALLMEDATGLSGKHEVDRAIATDPDRQTGSIFEAVDELGLTLSRRRVRMPTLIGDNGLVRDSRLGKH